MSGNYLGEFFSNRQEPGHTGLPVMSVTMNDSLVLRDDLDRRMESALRPDQHLLVRAGDIAYNMMRMWQGACGLADEDGMVSPAYVVLKPKAGIDSRFAYHWFKSSRMVHLFWAFSHGLTEDRLRLYYDGFAEIPVSPPSLVQQQRIVAVLDTWDRAIEEVIRLIEINKLSYRGELDRLIISVGNRLCRLDEIADVNVLSLTSKTDPHFEFDYFDIASAEDGVEIEFSGRMTFHQAPSRARRLIGHKEAVVYSTVRPLLRRIFIAPPASDVVYSTGYSIFEPRECCSAAYLKHALVSRSVEKQIYARQTGSGYPAISESDLAEVKIPVPETSAQSMISEALDDIERKTLLYSRYLNALRVQKRALMQNLFSLDSELDERFAIRTSDADSCSDGRSA